MFKKFIQKKLEKYVIKYFKKHPEVKLVVVTGSVGKTSAKRAIATVLSQKYRVRLHEGNHNTEISAPLAILGIEYPGNIRSLGAWLSVFSAARRRIRKATDVDVIIQELGSERPGEIAHFGTYLIPDIAVITAVSPEHMEFFGTIEAVAQEEITAANFSRFAIINRDDIEGRFAQLLSNPNIDTYGTTASAEFYFEEDDFDIKNGYSGTIITPSSELKIPVNIHVFGEHSIRAAIAAATVGLKLAMNSEEIKSGIAKIRPVPGRMNVLHGIDNTIIIDDTYNSSPLALSSAIRTLYSIEAPQRIAVLGSMNELGEVSAVEHQKIGVMCDPSLLSWVVTVGSEAEKYLAPSARSRGCQVKSFNTSIEAGAFVRSVVEPGSVVLLKGSEGGIYLEEAVKVLCVMSADHELVRQSPAWMDIKDEFFSKFK